MSCKNDARIEEMSKPELMQKSTCRLKNKHI